MIYYNIRAKIKSYEFINSFNLFILCIALFELKNKFKESNNEIIGLIIINVCKKKNAKLI